MRHLFDSWGHVSGRLRAASKIALFLDFDGTLARIRSHPEEVWVDHEMRRVLIALARNPRFRIWVISGRRRAELQKRIRVPGVRYLGLYGWEGRNSPGPDALTRAMLARVKASLGPRLHELPGIWIEDKDLAFSVHYRSAPEESAQKAGDYVQKAIAPYAERLRIGNGNKVYEVTPRELEDKGAAVRAELESVSGRAVPVYIGDDHVDEPAFSALSDGVTVRVTGIPRTNARYRLSGVRQVRAFLERLQQEFS